MNDAGVKDVTVLLKCACYHQEVAFQTALRVSGSNEKEWIDLSMYTAVLYWYIHFSWWTYVCYVRCQKMHS